MGALAAKQYQFKQLKKDNDSLGLCVRKWMTSLVFSA